VGVGLVVFSKKLTLIIESISLQLANIICLEDTKVDIFYEN